MCNCPNSVQYEHLILSSLGKPYFKKSPILWKTFIKWWPPPPPSCICEILIQIFNRKFRDKIKMRQNSVNNHQSHPKFRCSTRLMLWTSYLSLSYTSKHPILAQNMPFWAFKFLNRSMKTSRPLSPHPPLPPPPIPTKKPHHSLMVGWIGFKLMQPMHSHFIQPPVTSEWPKTASCRHSMGSCQHRLEAPHAREVVRM